MSVEVKLELGHRAVMREKVTQEGFTHDWTVFVRGAEGNNIQFFVEKVVFHLHESFPKPKRVVKEPPYSVSESGYAGFIMPIDVYFRTREEPKKVTFKYDLYLRLESPPVSNIRIEKLTFQNPSDDFRNKLIKAGGLAGALTGSAAGGSASLSTQACAPPQHVDEPPQISPPKPPVVVPEKKPRPHVPSKEIKSSQQPPPKQPSQPFTDIFGAPIRTKHSPDSSSAKSKDSGSSSQPKSKNTPNSSSTSSAKEAKSSSKESHKSKDSHHSIKDSRHSAKESHQSAKESHPLRDPHSSSKEGFQEKDTHQSKDSHPPKEGHTPKEIHHKTKEHHPKEGHKKENHHSSKEAKSSKDSLSSDSKVSKSSKSIKPDKESSKSAVKRAAPSDSHGSHGNAEKKKKLSPVSSESGDKSNNIQPKHKTKEGKEKTEKQKTKSFGNSFKKEDEKPKHKSSPAPPEPVEPKEMPKPKPISPKPPSPPPITVRPPSPPPKSPSPVSGSLYSGSDDESSKSLYKAHYSSPASSISESSLHSNIHQLSDHSIISPLSDDSNDDFLPPSKRKVSSDHDLDDASPEPKTQESKPPKLNKKHHAHSKSSKYNKSENFHRGNGSINSDISMHRLPTPELQNISLYTGVAGYFNNNNNNNDAYREELLKLQRSIMSLNDRRLVQNVVDVVKTTGKYEITNTTFDFDLCSLDHAIIQQLKHCLDGL